MKVSKNFYVHELVDKGTYEKFGDSSIWFLDPKAFPILQHFRDRLVLLQLITGNLEGV